MIYEKHVLKSGIEVEVRGRTYAEWEAAEERQASAFAQLLESVKENPRPVIMAEHEGRTLGNKLVAEKLALCVNGWDELKEKLPLRDVAELKKLIDSLEGPEVEEKN